MTEFGAGYAGVYDTLYGDKDYAAECDLIESAFERCAPGSIHRVLDLGCGTGNHALPLARRGYEVVGVDRSTGMLARARTKRVSRHARVRFRTGDVRRVRLGEQFDAALLMFAVLGYQLDDDDVRATLATARAHLRPGGLLVFDVWNGPAVIAQRPSERVKVARTGPHRIIRATSGELDERRNICTVRYQLWQLTGKRLTAEVREAHRMRYFFPEELRGFLAGAGFDPVVFSAFPRLDVPPSDGSWNVIAVARVRE